RQILAEALTEMLRIDPDVPVAVGSHVGRAGSHRACLGDRTEALANLRGKRRDVDQSHNIRLIAGFGDDRAAIRVSGEQLRSLLVRDHLSRARSVISERGERVLDGADGFISQRRKTDDDLAPVSGTAPESVHENNRRSASHLMLLYLKTTL